MRHHEEFSSRMISFACSLLYHQNWPGNGMFSRCTTCKILLECQFHGLVIAPSYMEYDDSSYAVPLELSAAVTIKSAFSINSTPPCQPYAYVLLHCKEHAPGPPLLLWICKLHPSQASCWTEALFDLHHIEEPMQYRHKLTTLHHCNWLINARP